MAAIKFEIEKKIGVLSENAKGWKKELNLVSWNGREAKFDLRDWDPNYEKMGKGLTFSKDEIVELKTLLNQLDL
ncbi:YdbC family protein [Alkalihalobacillus sp. BA299]|uniref:YdbC family protein n=1 Tax=Alkalihalobacillus sp. BA299 TaxID=2815938 RepID=UPI001AD9E096|nr:PC4/YdbC family ssDNA-binding protein [Alkalihalobacillus sp. BA299]